MIHSMTGFGRGEAQHAEWEAIVEMRSVNKRFCEVSVRLPDALADRENDVQALVKEAFDRGRISVRIELQRQKSEALDVKVDADAARAYKQLFEELREATQIEEPVRLEHLLKYGDVFAQREADEEALERAWSAIEGATAAAIEELRAMRRQEGKALEADLQGRIDAIEAEMQQVLARAPERVEEARERLQERIESVLSRDRVDPDRIEQEIAILAEKLDITEECVRLESHLTLFREALESDEAVGRKLNFVVQEIHREVNTIGSKANDPELSHGAVRMKEEVEKIREQIQNVE